jgi:uncharacterized protein
MSERLPREIDPIRLADEGVRLEGQLPGHGMARLHEQARPESRAEPVLVMLQFEHTAHGVRLMHGRVRTRVVTTCQRCLGPLVLDLEARPLMVLLAPGEAASGAPEDAESLTVQGPISLSDLMEDELLLVMPMIPVHAEDECHAPGSLPTPAAGHETRRKPFAALRGFKGKV